MVRKLSPVKVYGAYGIRGFHDPVSRWKEEMIASICCRPTVMHTAQMLLRRRELLLPTERKEGVSLLCAACNHKIARGCAGITPVEEHWRTCMITVCLLSGCDR